MGEYVAACLAIFDGSCKGRRLVVNEPALLLFWAAEWVTAIFTCFWIW